MELTTRQKHLGGAAALAAFVGLGAAIPAFGLFLGPFFKFGGGVLGGGLIAYLQSTGGRSGVRLGAIVGAVGGGVSAVLGSTVGTVLNVVVTADQGTELSGLLLLALVGFVTGWIFLLLGAALAGGAVGYLFGDVRETETVAA